MLIDDEEDVEEQADNVADEQPTSPVEEQNVDQTKAFAKRLKEETEKIRLQERENIAKEKGYKSWKEFSEAEQNSKLLDNGLDPETVRPVLKSLIQEDPEYVEAMKYKAEKEELEKQMFASNAIKALNDTFGTNYKSVDELDDDTIDMFNKGIPLEKAFAANNYTKLQEMALKQANKENGKSHLKQVSGSTATTKTRDISAEEMSVFRQFGVSVDEAKAYVNRTKK